MILLILSSNQLQYLRKRNFSKGRRTVHLLFLTFLLIYILSRKSCSVESFLNSIPKFHIKESSRVSSSFLSSKANSKDNKVYHTSFLSQDFSLFGGKNGKKKQNTYGESKEKNTMLRTVSFNNLLSNIKKVVNNEKKNLHKDEEDKFVPTYAEELCSPLGVLVSGWKEEELEILDDAIFTVMNDPKFQHHQDLSNLKMVSPTTDVLVPMLILAKSDAKTFLKDLLKIDVFTARDHELPEDNDEMNVTIPFVLFSGFTSTQIHQCMKEIRLLLHQFDCKNHPDGCSIVVEQNEKEIDAINKERREVDERKILFSMAVKNAMEKSVQVLYQEIISDYYENM